MTDQRKISMSWLDSLLRAKAMGDEDEIMMALGFFNDLRELGLIREDLIKWDMQEDNRNTQPESELRQ